MENKIDLLNIKEREVPFEKGYDFAMRYNIDFCSVSGKMKIGVDDIFYGYISKIDKKEISQLFFVLNKQDDYAKKIERSSCY